MKKLLTIKSFQSHSRGFWMSQQSLARCK